VRWILLAAIVAIGVPAVRLWAWSAILAALGSRPRAPLAPAAPQPDLAASTAAPLARPVVAGALPISPRADYRPIPSRVAPRPVAPGDPAEDDGGGAPVVLPPAPPPSAWRDVEIVGPFGVGTPAPGVTSAIRATLRPRLAECFQRGVQRRFEQLGRAFSTLAPGEEASAGSAILLLEVEVDGAGVRVVDAPVERRGSASDGTLNCAQGVLRGAALQAPSEGKRRFRMRFPLRP
jgi:hypothetical protein